MNFVASWENTATGRWKLVLLAFRLYIWSGGTSIWSGNGHCQPTCDSTYLRLTKKAGGGGLRGKQTEDDVRYAQRTGVGGEFPQGRSGAKRLRWCGTEKDGVWATVDVLRFSLDGLLQYESREAGSPFSWRTKGVAKGGLGYWSARKTVLADLFTMEYRARLLLRLSAA